MRYDVEQNRLERALDDFENGLATVQLNEVAAENWRELAVRAEFVDESLDCFEQLESEGGAILRPKRWYDRPLRAKWRKMPRAVNEDVEVK